MPSCVKGLGCSFSGVETLAQNLLKNGATKEEVAAAIYDVIARTLKKLIVNAASASGINRVLLAGGVASSGLLRKMLAERLKRDRIMLYFGRPELSSDNAVGVAGIGLDTLKNAEG